MPSASASGHSFADKSCINRLQKEYRALLRDPVPDIIAHPCEKSILEWHYVLKGSPESPYEGGVYHGKVVFPSEYPYKPPAIYVLTPNGRFATSTRLCLSMSDFHPETWNPMWSVASILNGLRSFMYEEAPTAGSITASTAERRRLAAKSLRHNVANATFRKLFPEWVEEQQRRDEQAKAAAEANAQNGGAQGAVNSDAREQVGPNAVAVALGDALQHNSLVRMAVFVALLAVLLVPLIVGDV
ncbi:ubiquitin-conjugating enzyme E2 [Pycnococcus provasolii]|uniref:E2 ubiquitin-conjugating enzyme n=1 Tax=Pycnococcus provasolii TaxID=41880 RepID=A0A7S2Z084_9CHLO|mmetsp:Transcript_780/g.1943  ORF Transcript_780/g.1943 Transcript_780/m.1943 type:complete len:243 (+) Transcript_780:240-968(+)